MPRPTLGADVIVYGISSNGALEHPAKVTRVFSDRDTAGGPVAVNLTIFPDFADPIYRSSVMLYEADQEARASCHGIKGAIAAYWPRMKSAAA